jgi:MFS family permease
MTSVANTRKTPVWRDGRAVALLLAATLTVMANATISPALPGLHRLFAADPDAALLTRLLVPAPSLSIALLAPFVGLAVDRHGRRRALLFGVVLFVVAGTAGLYLPDLRMIFVSRVVLGVAVALIMTAQTALVGDYFVGEARNALTGLQISARNFGGLVFIALAGWAAAVSPRYPFAVYGLALLILPLLWKLIVEPRRASPNPKGRDTMEAAQRPAWRLLFSGVVVAQALTNMFFFIIPTQMPFFFDTQGHDSAVMTGVALSTLMLTGGSVALAYSRIQRAIGHAGVLAAGYAAMAIGFLLLVLLQSAVLSLPGAAFVGAGYAMVSPGFVAMTLNIVPQPRRGLAGGILTASIFTGQFCSPLLSTPVVSASGYEALFLAAGAMLAVFSFAAAAYATLQQFVRLSGTDGAPVA